MTPIMVAIVMKLSFRNPILFCNCIKMQCVDSVPKAGKEWHYWKVGKVLTSVPSVLVCRQKLQELWSVGHEAKTDEIKGVSNKWQVTIASVLSEIQTIFSPSIKDQKSQRSIQKHIQLCVACFSFLTTLSREKVSLLEYGRFQSFQFIFSGKALIVIRKAGRERICLFKF